MRGFLKRVLADIDLALMQGEPDASRLLLLGIEPNKIRITGNVKFDISNSEVDRSLVDDFIRRFGIDSNAFTIVAASTHFPEEEYTLDAYSNLRSQNPGTKFKLIIAPRHPERFGQVSDLCQAFCEEHQLRFRERSSPFEEKDFETDVVLLDTIGELRSIYLTADVVIVGGSMIPHGGQSVLEPASVGKPILVGPYTHNFEEVIRVFLENKAVLQSNDLEEIFPHSHWLSTEIDRLFRHEDSRKRLSTNALRVMENNRGATVKTVDFLKLLADR